MSLFCINGRQTPRMATTAGSSVNTAPMMILGRVVILRLDAPACKDVIANAKRTIDN